MTKERQQTYLMILNTAILRIRFLGGLGMAKACAVEADHIHNLPRLLMNPSHDGEQLYLEVDRKVYEACVPEVRCSVVIEPSFEPLWKELQA
jgi:hypothetical protein